MYDQEPLLSWFLISMDDALSRQRPFEPLAPRPSPQRARRMASACPLGSSGPDFLQARDARPLDRSWMPPRPQLKDGSRRSFGRLGEPAGGVSGGDGGSARHSRLRLVVARGGSRSSGLGVGLP